MKRIFASALLLLISLPLIVQAMALGRDPESRLPACCRRGGMHHCAASAEGTLPQPGGEQLAAFRSKCPLYPQAITTAHHDPISLTDTIRALAFVFFCEIAGLPFGAYPFRSSRGMRYRRGPPHVVSSQLFPSLPLSRELSPSRAIVCDALSVRRTTCSEVPAPLCSSPSP